MIIRPRATSLRINSGSSFSRFATYCISSVTTPCRAKCICETFRLPFACPDTGRAPANPASLFSIQLSRNAIEPPQTPNACSATLDESLESRIRTTRWDYGTRSWVPQLATDAHTRVEREQAHLDRIDRCSEQLIQLPHFAFGHSCQVFARQKLDSRPRPLQNAKNCT